MVYFMFREGVVDIHDGCGYGDRLSTAESLRRTTVLPHRRANQGQFPRCMHLVSLVPGVPLWRV